MRNIILSLCSFILCFGILTAQDMGKTSEMEKKDEMKKGEMKQDGMNNEMVCPHCSKDKKCDMHVKEDMKNHKMGMKKEKEMACPHCTKDKKCDMHVKEDMKNHKMGMKKEKEMACPHCTKDKKCDMHANKDMNKVDSPKK